METSYLKLRIRADFTHILAEQRWERCETAELRDMAAGLQPARWQILPSGFDPCLLHIKAIFRVRNKISSVLGSPGECLLGYRPPASDGVARAP